MKIYVVTRGCYSEIEKVFTDKAKAEEYKEWLPYSNDIDEYEIEDDFIVNKYYEIYIWYSISDDKKYVRILKCNGNIGKNRIYYSDGGYEINMYRYVTKQHWNEEFYINKHTKEIYDLANIVKQKIDKGDSIEDIQEFLDKYNENEVMNMNEYNNLPTADEYRKCLENTYGCYFKEYSEYSEPKYQCPKCNGGMCRNEMVVLTSYPPKRKYKCNKCGYVEYQLG